MRTRRLVSLMLAFVAGIIWVLSTLANISNAWDPLNFVLRVAAGVVTVAAAAEWLVLTVRAARRPEGLRDDEELPLDGPPIVEDRPGPDAFSGLDPYRDSLADEGLRTGPARAPHADPRSDQQAGPEPSPAPYLDHESYPGPFTEAEPVPPAHPEPLPEFRPDAGADREPTGGGSAGRVRHGPAVPRSAGSAVLGGVLSRFGRRRTPDQDLAVVVGGGAVRVGAYLMERKVRRVTLRVGLDPESLDALAEVLGDAPHRVFGTQAPTRGLFARAAYTQIEGASGSGAWSIAVRSEDVEVLRYALSRAAEFR
ncbi:hypothetical protein ACIG47_14915 [Promicromonospora sp. NPDC052451]|uniref:hypothetical protein n=1 Tax=Promicromonospora sp. NPDC052451 TaxID=3364407 RepID=UPI0037C8F57F